MGLLEKPAGTRLILFILALGLVYMSLSANAAATKSQKPPEKAIVVESREFAVSGKDFQHEPTAAAKKPAKKDPIKAGSPVSKSQKIGKDKSNGSQANTASKATNSKKIKSETVISRLIKSTDRLLNF